MELECPTCLTVIENRNIQATACGHVFHSECLTNWMQLGNNSCPECRQNVYGKTFRLYPSMTNENYNKTQWLLAEREKDIVEQNTKNEVLTEEIRVQEELKTTLIRDLEERNTECEQLRYQMKIDEKELRRLKDLERLISASDNEVEQILRGYNDLRTLAAAAASLKKALSQTDSKKLEWRTKLHETRKQHVTNKISDSKLLSELKKKTEEAIAVKDSEIKELKTELESVNKSVLMNTEWRKLHHNLKVKFNAMRNQEHDYHESLVKLQAQFHDSQCEVNALKAQLASKSSNTQNGERSLDFDRTNESENSDSTAKFFGKLIESEFNAIPQERRFDCMQAILAVLKNTHS